MNSLIQCKTTILSLLIASVFACFGLLPKAEAVVPAPDGGYPSGNTAEGQNALFSLTTGGFNTAVGYFALRSDSTGGFNTALGAGALFSNMGDQNTAIGVAAGLNLTTGNSNICIGSGVVGVAGQSNTIRIGDNLPTSSGISSCYIGGILGDTLTVGLPVFIDNINQRLGVLSSSERFKKDISTMETASEAILSLRPVTFHYKSDTKDTPQFGLIAEEVAKVNPALVLPDKEGKPYTVRYEAVNAMLLNEFLKEHKRVQEQQATISHLKQDLQATAARQQKQIEALTAVLLKVSAQLEASKPAPQTVVNTD